MIIQLNRNNIMLSRRYFVCGFLYEYEMAARPGAQDPDENQQRKRHRRVELPVRRQRPANAKGPEARHERVGNAYYCEHHEILLRRDEIGSGEKRRHHYMVRLR